MATNELSFNRENEIVFHNAVDFCVGTGRLGLALDKEYLDQLKMVQDVIGFKHIRGHGLFCDDVAIYQEYEEDGKLKVEYNFTYIDRIFDSYIELNIRPFLELGFMPKKMASGSQTIFYWKGNTTPPKEYSKWCDMVTAFLTHLLERYGEEVLEWPIEVWNEPNLPGFWEKADMKEYFFLFKETFNAIKALNPKFTVGGPAICGVNDETWIREFMQFVKDNGLKIDFVTRHHYTIEFPERAGHYDYSKLMKAEDGFNNLQTTRDIIDSFEEYKGLPIHITEFSSSYTPKGVIHDTNLNAAWLAQQLSRLGDMNESYSYWTFGDVFEEQGVPFTPFHGGFGLVANGCIPKPTFWTFAFYKELKEKTKKAIYRDDNMIIVEKPDGGYAGVVWNIAETDGLEWKLNFDVEKGEYVIVQKTVDEMTCNPLKTWHNIGEPANLKKDQLELIKSAANPSVRTKRATAEGDKLVYDCKVKSNGVVYFEITKINPTCDRGYDYERVISFF